MERTEPNAKADCLLEVLDGVGGGRVASSVVSPWSEMSEVRSILFPASNTVRLGDARARASMRKVGRDANEV